MGTLHRFMRARQLSQVITLFSILCFSFYTGCAHKEQPQQEEAQQEQPQQDQAQQEQAQQEQAQQEEPPEEISHRYKRVQTITLPEHSVSHDVYVFSDTETFSKPPVILLHELPGLNESTIKYAESLQDQFTVYVPLLFGSFGQDSWRKGWNAYTFNGEWWKMYKPKKGSRKITQWLHQVVDDIGNQHPQQNVGIIGMCLTGAMPLTLVDNEKVHAVVIAQPSLPLFRWIPWAKDSLDIPEDEWESAKQQFKDRQVYAYGVRFEKDSIARREKHERLINELNCETCKGAFIDAEISETEYQEADIPEDAHSTLTFHLGETDQNHPAEKRRREIKQFLVDPSYFYNQHASSTNTLPPQNE